MSFPDAILESRSALQGLWAYLDAQSALVRAVRPAISEFLRSDNAKIASSGRVEPELDAENLRRQAGLTKSSFNPSY